MPNTGGHDQLDDAALRQLTNPSGAFTEVVHADADAVNVAERIATELRLQYLLGFAPAHPNDGKFHTVKVAVSGCNTCRVRARSGHIADKATNP